MTPPSSAAPPTRISYWRARTSAEQPPDFVGTPEEVRTYRAQHPVASEALAVIGFELSSGTARVDAE